MNGPGEATNTDSTNRLNTISSPVNTVSSSFTTVDPGRAKEQRNEGWPSAQNWNQIMSVRYYSQHTRIHKDHPKAQIIGEIEPKKVFRNKRDQRGIVVRNKARLVAQGHRQEEGVDYDEVFVPVARIKAIMLFLAFASFMGFTVYQIDEYPIEVKQRKDGIFLSQDKYVYDILKKFGFSSVKTASTPIETHKPLLQDTAGTDVDVHLYRSMIGSLMYLTSSKPDIMFAVCAWSNHLGLWYLRIPPMGLLAYSDSDYAGASIDRKSTTGGCQFLGCKLISWQCKKQTIMANSTTEAEYIVASNYYGQVLWLQNQLLDYGYNFMKTKIHVDNESAIYVVGDKAVHKELGDRMERAATTASSFEAEQDSSGPGCQETILGM
ncbi:putative ribonuclease H-like domain-containing protein [Tanacetum coccineum]|uniref:Ribonuclease H-like domain-containing protein n=1 Tax=Tanacetum coccineum TaxID=301880 RepID=A0ABQ5HHM5_9ASTR